MKISEPTPKRDSVFRTIALIAFLHFTCTDVSARPNQSLNEKPAPTSSSEGRELYRCGGSVESEVWMIWDKTIANYTAEQINERLNTEGDVYSLYDLQVQLSNLLSMADRCSRSSRLREFAKILRPAFDGMSPGTLPPFSKVWKCKGGKLCNKENSLIGKELMLVSVQFLGLTSNLSKILVLKDQKDTDSIDFVKISTKVALDHIQKWTQSDHLNEVNRRIHSKSTDARGFSADLLTDKDIWMSIVISNLATIRDLLQENNSEGTNPLKGAVATYFAALERLILNRVRIQRPSKSGLYPSPAISVDSGFWTKFPDNRFAMHKGEPPVRCERKPGSETVAVVNEWASEVPLDPVATWDISHARRFVHFFAARIDDRSHIKNAMNVDANDWKPFREAMAAQIINEVWNQSVSKPLFTNYLNGRNGWYRVGYDRGDGTCTEGVKPFGLSNSFPTGGYIEWASDEPKLHTIGQALHGILNSSKKDDREFVRLYYPRFGENQSATIRFSEMTMFLPSLIVQ